MYQLPPKPHSVQETLLWCTKTPPKPHSVQETPFWCTKRHQSHTRYRRHPSGVQTSTNATLGTGDTPLVYQTPPKPHSVQETPLWCTKRHKSRTRYKRHPSGVPKRHQSHTRYRRHPSGVPTATKAALGTGDTPLAYQTPPKPHSVQETPLWRTNCHQSHTRYRRHPSGVPNATSTFEKVLRETVSYYIFAK